QELDVDFLALSSHKAFGPTGTGILYGKYELLEKLPPVQGGGDMIETVTLEKTEFEKPPLKFEAGTPAIAQVIGFGAAIDYLSELGMDNVRKHEMELTKYTLEKMSQIKGIVIYGTKDISKRGGVISFNFHNIHPHDIATIVDREGIAIRSGHHCAQVLMERLDVAATNRASFYIYNTKDDVDKLIQSLAKVSELFKL
ncbi:hypothetical protein LCGC14_1989400, partial [marine sediment metagenome]